MDHTSDAQCEHAHSLSPIALTTAKGLNAAPDNNDRVLTELPSAEDGTEARQEPIASPVDEPADNDCG